MKGYISVSIILLVCILCSGCFTSGHISGKCGRCCIEEDLNVESHSAYLDVDSNLIVNFKAKIGEEKETREHHIIINLQELLDSVNLFPKNEEVEYYYTSKNSQLNYFSTESVQNKVSYIYVGFKRKALKSDYYFPENSCNVSKELRFYKHDDRIGFRYDPPNDDVINNYIYSVEPYVPFRIMPYFLVPATFIADIVTFPLQLYIALAYKSPR